MQNCICINAKLYLSNCNSLDRTEENEFKMYVRKEKNKNRKINRLYARDISNFFLLFALVK